MPKWNNHFSHLITSLLIRPRYQFFSDVCEMNYYEKTEKLFSKWKKSECKKSFLVEFAQDASLRKIESFKERRRMKNYDSDQNRHSIWKCSKWFPNHSSPFSRAKIVKAIEHLRRHRNTNNTITKKRLSLDM